MTASARTIGPSSRAEDATQENQLKVVFRRFRRHRLAMISSILLLMIFVASLLAPVITTFPRDAIDVSSEAVRAARHWQGRCSHLLGIDYLGRIVQRGCMPHAHANHRGAGGADQRSHDAGRSLHGGRRTALTHQRVLLTIPRFDLCYLGVILLKRGGLLLPGFFNKL
jgi:hypothetical protein